MAEVVGYAALQIIPSVRGLGIRLQQQLIGPAGDAGARAGDAASGGLKDKLLKGGAAVGIAAGALLARGLADAFQQADVSRTLQAQLGTSNSVAAAQGKIAGKLYSTGVSDSFTDAAEAIKAVSQAGLAPPGATNKQLQSIATKASDVSSVFGQDLGGVTNSVSQLMRTGLAKNSTQAFDLITKGFQSGADKGGDFLDTLNEYGTQFRKLGITGPAAVGLINQGLKAGARDSDVVADSLKEFSIRAVDGSKTTAQGFKSLGLSAKDMSEQIGKGGTSASGGLDTVLDKLRGIKDPVKQSQIAVELFGTQAEDMGKALFALDPSKATAGLGKFAGAADKTGKVVRSGPSYQLQTFQRTVMQGLVTFLGGTLIPALTTASSWLSDHLGPAIKGVTDVVSGTVGWFQKWGIYLAPLGIVLGGLTLALTANAIASGISTAATWAGVTAITVAEGVTSGFAAAMGVLNAVMDLNPIALIVIALVALGAALVIAWKKSDTFRAIVMGAWQGIQTAALWAWDNVLKPTFSALTTAFDAVGAAASWLWTNAIKPTFGWISDKALWLWNNGIKPQFDAVKSIMHTVGDAASWLWRNAIKPAFQSVGDKANWLWKNVLKPSFDLMKKGMKAVGDSFSDARDFISKAWTKVQDIAKKPVKFLINTIYNGGIVPMWNKVATAFGANPLGKFNLPKGFAAGGRVFGAGTETSDSVPALLSRNEHVWTAKEVKGAGGHGAVMAMRQAAAAGMLPGFKDGGGLFGWVGSAASALKGAGSSAWSGIKSSAKWLKDSLESSARAGVKAVVNPLLSKLPGADTGFGQLVRTIPTHVLDSIFGYSKKADSKVSASLPNVGGAGVSRWRPYVIKALSANGLSTSASMVAKILRQISTESGGNPKAVQGQIGDINNKTGDLAKGLMQTISATFNHYKFPGHGNVFNGYDNLLAALNYAKHQYGASLSFLGQGHGYDSGGWLQPGVTRAVNKTGQPEAILTGPQWQAVAAQAAAGQAATAAYRAAAAGRPPGGGAAQFEGNLYLDSGEFLGRVRGEANQVFNTRLSSLSQRARAGAGGR